MRLYKYSIVICLIFASWTACADSAAEQLTAILANLQGLQAYFVQTVYAGNGSVLQKTSGEMFLQRPAKFRWQTQKPVQQLLIADGKNVWFYDVNLAQVTVQKQKISESSPAMLLSGSTQTLLRDFTVVQSASNKSTRQLFKLFPKDKSHLFQSVLLDFQNGKLQAMKLSDNLGQVTTIKFSRVHLNPSLNPALFRFTPPKGVDVVTE